MMTLTSRTSAKGFTIVELLIVVVVIAILAAITIVAYNGITRQADDSARLTDAGQFGKKLESKKVLTGLYTTGATDPATRAAFVTTYDIQSLSSRLVIVNYDGYGGDPSEPDKKKIFTYSTGSSGGSNPEIWVSYWSHKKNSWMTNHYYDNGSSSQTLNSIPPYPG